MEPLKENSPGRVIIFDTTLRDGQQCPGAGMSAERNIEYALLAAEASIDVLEAGFPSASTTDFEIVREIARQYAALPGAPVVCALSQLRSEQVDKTIEALLGAQKGRVHIYVPIDPALMVASLGTQSVDRGALIRAVSREVQKAVSAGMEVEFSPEGYSRQGENFSLCFDLIRAAVENGATVINCPDTIGGAHPYEGEAYFVHAMMRHQALLDAALPGNTVTWSTHCHNDLGLALVNSLEAVVHGPATQIEGCVNGIGERAGNVSIEQCVMALQCVGPTMNPPRYTMVKTEMLKTLSDFIATHMLPRQPHWPICGENASRHSSGGHTNAILKNPLAYQPFDPRTVGKQISFVFGPLSGSNHARKIIEDAGFIVGEEEKVLITQFIKDLYAERRKGITDEELLIGYKQFRSPIRVDEIEYARTRHTAKLKITGKFFDRVGTYTEEIEGADSALTALKILIDRMYPGLTLEHFESHSSDPTIHAVGLSTIILKDRHGSVFRGKGEDRDTQISAMKALIDATNTAFIHQHFRKESTVAPEGGEPKKKVSVTEEAQAYG